MDRWKVYEILKRNINMESIEEIEKIDAEEVKEGLIEWLYVLTRNDERVIK
jgi:hypothetical protein